MVMLEVLHDLSKTYNWHLSVVTIDHLLRRESANDCAFVEKRCNELGIKCLVRNVDVLRHAKQNKLSLETAAREKRYGVLNELAKQNDFVCLAHHRTDHAETIMLNLLRGSGSKGIGAMKVLSGKLARPLLNTSKDEIESYAAKRGVKYVVDETNSQDIYSRNFLRNKIFPLMTRLNAKAIDNIVSFAEILKQDNDFFNSHPLFKKVVLKDGGAFVPNEVLNAHPALASRAVILALELIGAEKDCNRQQIGAVLGLNETNKRLNLSSGAVAVKGYEGVTITKEAEEETKFYSTPFRFGEHIFDKKTIDVSLCQPSAEINRTRGRALVCDAETIPSGSCLRYPLPDDVFFKHNGGSCKLSKHLSDRKIPLGERGKTVVLACGSEVLAILGLDITQKIQVTEKTKQAVKLSIKEN